MGTAVTGATSPTLSSGNSARSSRSLSAIVAAIVLIPVSLRVLQGWLCRIGSTKVWDNGPAYLAMRVNMLVHGVPLYRDIRKPPYIGVLYGPVIPSLVAVATPLFGSGGFASLKAGRVVAVCSTIAVCLLIFLLAKRQGARPAAALIGSLAFALSPMLEPWGFAFRVDTPVLACELTGLWLFASGFAYASVGLFVLSYFVKQFQMAGIAAVVLFSWLAGNRRGAITCAALWLGAVVAVTAILQLIFPYYWLNTYTALAPLYDPRAPYTFLTYLVPIHFTIFSLAGIGLLRSDRTSKLGGCFLVLAAIENAASCLRWGSNFYYFLPTLAGAVIVASPELDRLLSGTERFPRLAQAIVGGIIAWVIVVQLYLGQLWLGTAKCGFTDFRAVFKAGLGCGACSEAEPWDPRAIQQLRALKGTVMTDDGALALANPTGNLELSEFVLMRSMRDRGVFDDRPLLESIGRHEITAFALDADRLEVGWRGTDFFWPALRDAISRNYFPLLDEKGSPIGPPYLMIPRAASQSGH